MALKKRRRTTRAKTPAPHPPTPKRERTKPVSTRQNTSKPDISKKTSINRSPFTLYPTSKVYHLIESGPVLLVSTGPSASPTSRASKDSKNTSITTAPGTTMKDDINLMTMGFHMMLQHGSPALIGACIGPWDATYARLAATRECVLAVPGAGMARAVVDIGNCSAADDDDDSRTKNKFERFGLAALPAARVDAPLVGGEHIIANVECVVEDDGMVGRYNLWVLRVVKAWVNQELMAGEGGKMFHHRGDGTFTVDGEIMDLRERMVKWRMFQD
ncbi:hypothetical protein VTI28DRAFT_7132 [Corynascus sepedonium]